MGRVTIGKAILAVKIMIFTVIGSAFEANAHETGNLICLYFEGANSAVSTANDSVCANRDSVNFYGDAQLSTSEAHCGNSSLKLGGSGYRRLSR